MNLTQIWDKWYSLKDAILKQHGYKLSPLSKFYFKVIFTLCVGKDAPTVIARNASKETEEGTLWHTVFFLYDVEITAQELNKFCVFDVLIVIYQWKHVFKICLLLTASIKFANN